MNIVEKILAAHRVPDAESDGEIALAIDQVLTQDTAGPMAFLQFEAMDIPRIRVKRALTIIDHQTVQDGYENADDHAYLRSAAARFGAIYSPAGNGICHQVVLERFSRPGWTMIGTDSHTPTAGGAGMLAIGAGGLDVAVTMGGAPFYLPRPEVVLVELIGRLPEWSSAKDVALEVLRVLGVKGNVGRILEYGGDGVTSLSVPQRGTIANMGTETGATSSIFPADEVTRKFLAAQGREADFSPLAADPDAEYARRIRIDLSTVRPAVALPYSPGNVADLEEVASRETVRVDQVLIGSCTNSSYRDLATVAAILKGRKVARGVSLGIAPGSRQVLAMLAASGELADLVAAGARILESACGFCCGCGQAPGSGAVSVRTSNRNFKGRTGTADAKAYLVSPESAAVTALTGVLADPSEAAIPLPSIPEPERFWTDDNLFEGPDFASEIRRGPNIGTPPSPPIPGDSLTGRVLLVLGDDITTDHILPAGSLMKLRSNVPLYSRHVFAGVDPDFADRCAAATAAGASPVIVAGLSYGQGSSREHAAICPMHLGVRAVIAKSYERIHHANLVNFGILPLVFADPADHHGLGRDDAIRIDDVPGLIRDAKGMVHNDRSGREISVRLDLSKRQKTILLAGGLLRLTRQSSQTGS